MKHSNNLFDNFRLAIAELGRGENLDLYIIIVSSIVVAVLNIAQITDSSIISAAMLTALAFIGNALLENRRSSIVIQQEIERSGKSITALESLRREITSSKPASKAFSRGYPDLTSDFRSARSVNIVALTLASTLVPYYAEFEQLLQRGGCLKIVINEPSPKLLELLATRSASTRDVKVVDETIRSHLGRARTLKTSMNSKENFEIRTMPYPTPFGIIFVEKFDGTSKIYIKLSL